MGRGEHPPRIQREEFQARQERARALAAERGLDGLVVWGRCGGSHDRYADLLYLTSFYSHFPFISDQVGQWRGRGHGALVLPVDGGSVLVSDLPAHRDDLTVADEVIAAGDVVEAVRSVVDRTIGEAHRVGVLGGDVISAPWMQDLPGVVPADEIGMALRLVKSDAELELLRAAGVVGSRAVDAVMEATVPGATEAEAMAAGIAEVVAAGGAFIGAGISSGPDVHLYSQSQPAPYDGLRPLRPGDMFRVDMYGSVDGYLFDFARSRVVGAGPTRDQKLILDATRDAVLAGVGAVSPGATLGTVAEACEETFAASGFSDTMEEAPRTFVVWGHGLGLAFESPWISTESPEKLEPGMVLALERRVAVPGVGGATHEENLIVTADGCEVTSTSRSDYA